MQKSVVHAVAITFTMLSPFLISYVEVNRPVALAADALKADGLPSDPRQFRAAVDQLLAKVDSVIAKLKSTPGAQGMVLDLMQTRDNVLREISKIDGAPGDAKWNAKEMRESVESMLKLMKEQYDKAAATAGS